MSKKVIVNDVELDPATKVKLWEQEGYNRHRVRELIVKKREELKAEEK